MNKIPVILDCDTSNDDAFAIAMCIASDKIDLLGISTVAGNFTLPEVLLNTRRALSVTDPTVPYAVGAEGPIARPLRTHGYPTHRFAELGDPSHIKPVSDDAVEFLYEKIMGSEEPVTLFPLAPLTNIYHLFERHPDVKQNIKEMVIMGGSVHSGNETINSEFNILVDPEAAREVFAAGVPIVLFAIEGCNDAYFTIEDAHELENLGNKTARHFGHSLVVDFDEKGLCFTGYPRDVVYDGATVMWLLHPESLVTKDTYMEVIAGLGHPQDGCTYTDWRPKTWKNGKPNVKVVMQMDTQVFQDTVFELFHYYDDKEF